MVLIDKDELLKAYNSKTREEFLEYILSIKSDEEIEKLYKVGSFRGMDSYERKTSL